MVAFPDPEERPKLLSVSNLNDSSHRTLNKRNQDDRIKADRLPIVDTESENNYKFFNLFNGESEILSKKEDVYNKLENNNINANIKTDQITAKKIAASIKAPVGVYVVGGNGHVPPSPGGGSLSSGSSIVTISSITTTDPDPGFPDGGSDGSGKNNTERILALEKWYTTALQISVPFFIAGIGTIGAGLVLSTVQNWEVFKNVGELFILAPALLGLKGNLDMCLASRLSTQANIGNMSSCRNVVKMIVGNITLVQIQATVAAILVAVFAISAGALMNGSFSWNNSILLMTASVCTATSSCFVLDFVMIAVIMASHRCKLNPDNLATPLAASIGDVVSISVLSTIASSLFVRLDTEIWILYTILGVYLSVLPLWIFIVLKNKYTKKVLTSGWTPVLSALFISGLGGLVLDQAVEVFDGFTIFQPIINGIGGNLVSVQASRISTMLHQSSIMGILPPHAKILVSPWAALFKGVPYAKTARILLGMVIPGQLVFIFVADFIQWGYSTLDVYFVVTYLAASILQVMLLLYLAHIIIHAMWRYKIDPDNSAIPYLTSVGDLIGSLLLAAAFSLLGVFGKFYGDYQREKMQDVI